MNVDKETREEAKIEQELRSLKQTLEYQKELARNNVKESDYWSDDRIRIAQKYPWAKKN